jgi:hypothetical protein
MEEAHEFREAPRHGLIVILHQQAVFRRSLALKKPMKSGYNLSESLFEGRHTRGQAPKTSLVGAFRKEMTIIPASDGFGDLLKQFAAFS